MVTTIISFITGSVLPFIAKTVQSKQESKALAEERAFELEKIKAQAEAVAAAQIKTAEAAIVQSEAQVAVSANEMAKEAINVKTGYKWIDGSISLVRALFGFADLLLYVFGAAYLAFWKHEVILTQPEISIAFFTVIGFFFGERCVKKAWGK
jgi:hypothetical protein